MSFELERDSVTDRYGKKRSRFRVQIPPHADSPQLPTRINLRRAREEAGLTQEQLTNAVSTRNPDTIDNIQHLGGIEQGRRRITPEIIQAVADATGMDAERLRGADFDKLSTQKLRRSRKT